MNDVVESAANSAEGILRRKSAGVLRKSSDSRVCEAKNLKKMELLLIRYGMNDLDAQVRVSFGLTPLKATKKKLKIFSKFQSHS